jgi:predicted Zn-dependent protease with MMP-like domain
LTVDRNHFELLVAEAMDLVPEPFASALAGVAVVVEDRAPAEDPDLYGLYIGAPLDEPWAAVGNPPPRIAIYMYPLADDCETLAELVDEVRITVMHELGHHLGLDEDDLEDLGYG